MNAQIDPSIIFIPLLPLLVAGAVVWHFSRSRSILETWAAANGYEIVQREYCSFFKGPFFWRCSKGQTVYRVTVKDRDGIIHSGWVRCGGWAFGLWSDEVAVRWET